MECISALRNALRLGEVWPTVAPWIKRALERGDLGTFQELQQAVFHNDALLWVARRGDKLLAACVTQIRDTERSRVLLIQALGGRRWHDWRHLLPLIEGYGRQSDCTCVRVLGRKGWQRLLPYYKLEKVILERQL